MKISVVTVCYNSVNTIENTIKSVINQKQCDIEYIIVDGGSVDGTLSIIEKYDKHIDKWISEKDNGIYDAMNKAIRMVDGDWIIFLNSDDVFYDNNVLNRVENYLYDTHTIYYGNVITNPFHEGLDGSYNKWRLSICNICHQAIFYPIAVFRKYSYQMRYKLYADWHLNIRCMGDKEFKFEHIQQVVSVFSTTGMSAFENDGLFLRDFNKIIVRYLGYRYLFYSVVYRKASRLLRVVSQIK